MKVSLGEILGAIMSDITHARRIADEQAVRMAEYYESEPLLRGLPIPRVRLPEVVLDMPLMIDGLIEGRKQVNADLKTIVSAIVQSATEVSTAAGLDVTDSVLSDFRKRLTASVQQLLLRSEKYHGVSLRLQVKECAIRELVDATSDEKVELTPEVLQAFDHAFKKVTNDVVIVQASRVSELSVNVETARVKSEANQNTLSRLRIVMNEEGLEWSHYVNNDGVTVSNLSTQ